MIEHNPDFPDLDDLPETIPETPEDLLGADLMGELLGNFWASPEGKAKKAYNEAYELAKRQQAEQLETEQAEVSEPEAGQPEAGQPEAGQPEPDAVPSDTASDPAANPDVDARTRANRQNARKSSGPTSIAGKAASSRNAITHGIFVQDLSQFLPIQELDRYNRFVKSMVDDLRPSGATELVLARRAADIQFRLEMLRTAEMHAYSNACTVAGSMPALIARHKDPLSLVSLYDSRFQRSFRSTMDDLYRLQKTRKAEEDHALNELRTIALKHLQEGTTFNPADFGFVISRDLVFQKARLQAAQNHAKLSMSDISMGKKVVDCTPHLPRRAA